MKEASLASPPFRSGFDRLAQILAIGLLLFAMAVATQVSRNRSFQVDEVEHLHSSYNLLDGRMIYRDYWEGHNPLLYFTLAPLLDKDDPVSSYGRARWLLLGLLLLHVLLASYCAGKLGGPMAAVLGGGLLLLHSTFVERGIEVRPDGPMSLCTTLALALELAGGSRVRRYCLQGLALSLAFLFTQKAVFGCFGFGCLWLWSSIRERRPALLLLPLLAWSLPVAFAAGGMLIAGNFDDYLRWNFGQQLKLATHLAASRHSFGPIPFLWQEGRRNLFFCLAGVLGLLHLLRSWGRPGFGFSGFLALLLVGSLWINPFPFPYFHVSVLPLLAIAAGVTLADHFLRKPRNAVLLMALALAAGNSLPRLLDKAKPGTELQFEVLGEVQRITQPTDCVFDLAGLYFRPDAYPIFVMTAHMLTRYAEGAFPPILPALRSNGPAVILSNYRISMLPPKDLLFIDSHYTHYDKSIFVPGTRVDGLRPGLTKGFEVLKAANFRYEGPGQLLLDGRPFVEGPLAKGSHLLGAGEFIPRGRLILSTPEPRPDNPTKPQELFINFD